MDTLLEYALIIHVTAGAISLLSAPVSLLTKKGGSTHNRFGKIFFWSMTVIFITSLFVSIFKGIPFLFFLSILSFYATIFGVRILKYKNSNSSFKVKTTDWIISGSCQLFNTALIGYSLFLFLNNGYNNFAVLSIVFGIAGTALVYSNVKLFLRKDALKTTWLKSHISNMITAFIAATTAFSVNTLPFLPILIQWLWPTILGVPLIIYFSKKYTGASKKGVAI